MDHKNKSELSVIIIAGAEEHNIRECLESVSFADEIVVLYSHTADNTAEIASKFTPNVYFREFDGYATQKQAALDKATKEWVLSIDADERVTPELQSEIEQVLSNDDAYNGYSIPRKNFVMNRWLRFGGNYPDHQFRLFKRKGAGLTQRLVHEGFTISGKRGRLTQPLIHYTLPNIQHMLAKNVKYAMYEAQEKQHRGRVGVLDVVLRPPIAFIKKYFLAMGFRDGWMGFIYSLIHAVNKLQVQMYIWELQHPGKSNEGKG